MDDNILLRPLEKEITAPALEMHQKGKKKKKGRKMLADERREGGTKQPAQKPAEPRGAQRQTLLVLCKGAPENIQKIVFYEISSLLKVKLHSEACAPLPPAPPLHFLVAEYTQTTCWPADGQSRKIPAHTTQ